MSIRYVCALAASASMIGLTATAFSPLPLSPPPATAQEQTASHRTVSAGTMDWGVRESFRKYIETGVAKGSISTDEGASRSGATFQFPAESSAITGPSSGQFNFIGSVHFSGHDGSLELTLSNPILVVNGTSAELRVDYSTRKYVGAGAVGPVEEGQKEVLATITLDAEPDFTANQATLSGQTSLTSSGANIFAGFYEAGEPLDPVSIELSLKDASGAGPTPDFTLGPPSAGTSNAAGQGRSGPMRSKATSGPAFWLGQINDTLVEVNGLFNNADKILRSATSLHERATSSSSQQAVRTEHPSTGSRTTTAAANKALARNEASAPTSPSSNVSAHSKSGAAAAAPLAGNASSNTVCDGDTSRGVTSAEAQWGIRQSFRTYIRGNIAKGKWELQGVGDSGGAFTFNGNSGAVDTATRSGSILYPGSIRFTGHGGILDTRFSNMEIQFSGNTGKLILNATSNTMEGEPRDYGRIAIADLTFTSLDVSDSAVTGTAEAELTSIGSEAFGQFYPPGDPLDTIHFTAQLGGSANCADGQGTTDGASPASNSAAGADARAKLRKSVASSATPARGSVLDEHSGDTTTSSPDQPEGGKFQIKNTAPNSRTGADGWDDATVATLLVLIASLLGAGGALIRFAVIG
ncbi:HtaA domain-containing protein [Corynebacterium sp. NML140438]|uniref:HtaA domain-containing protein n=1 Tax=Corynebacterium sp. NML140438 TaxID=1906334 RepID=UPI0009F5BB3B